jgi:hypothetical protein
MAGVARALGTHLTRCGAARQQPATPAPPRPTFASEAPAASPRDRRWQGLGPHSCWPAMPSAAWPLHALVWLRQAGRGGPPAATNATPWLHACPAPLPPPSSPSPCRHQDYEQRLANYFGAGVTPAHLKLADLPQGQETQLVEVLGANGANSPFPLVRCRNVFVLPGVPQLVKQKWPAVRKQLFELAQLSPYHNLVLRLGLTDEAAAAPLLDQLAEELGPELAVGSYPVRAGRWLLPAAAPCRPAHRAGPPQGLSSSWCTKSARRPTIGPPATPTAPPAQAPPHPPRPWPCR